MRVFYVLYRSRSGRSLLESVKCESILPRACDHT